MQTRTIVLVMLVLGFVVGIGSAGAQSGSSENEGYLQPLSSVFPAKFWDMTGDHACGRYFYFSGHPDETKMALVTFIFRVKREDSFPILPPDHVVIHDLAGRGQPKATFVSLTGSAFPFYEVWMPLKDIEGAPCFKYFKVVK